MFEARSTINCSKLNHVAMENLGQLGMRASEETRVRFTDQNGTYPFQF